MERGLGDALDEMRIVAAACALLCAKGDAKTRQLVRHLAESGMQIDKSRLNQILYRHARTTPGLSVNDHTWHFEPPTKSPDSAASSRLAAQAPPATRASNTGPHSSSQPALAARGGAPVEPLKSAHFELSLEQRAIVDAEPTRWLLVEAGPGTGKTAVALARVATLLDRGVPPSAILMVSFTRTAVAELRQRIETLAKDVAAVAAVRITTLDAEAWNLGVSFQGGRITEKLARGFDGNIEDAIALFRSNDPALCDWIAQTRHVIIDEAQDLVGRRSELVFQILDHLSSECGVTVFVDPAQAIYGFAEGDGDEDGAERPVTVVPFHQQLTKNFPGQFRVCCLTRLYRSSSPTLRRVFEQGRAIVLGMEPAPQRLERLRETAHAVCATTLQVDNRPSLADDELVLFRRRSEVLLASSFLASKHVPHRIRMGQTSLGAHAWLACLFGVDPATVIDRRELDRRWDLAAGLPSLRGLDRDHTWKLLGRLAGTSDGKAIDVRVLRRLLARARPPAELCQTEVGVAGPIIGTIHGSKGREANTVSLMLSKVHEAVPALELDEEVRVTYVGSTRARHELLVGKGYVGFGFKALGKSGRVYRPCSLKGKGPGRIQVELGRPGDVDELAVVSRTRWTATDVNRGQSFLTGYAGEVVSLTVTAANDHAYLLATKDGIPLGALSPVVNKDLFAIAKAIDEQTSRKPPNSIPFASLIGLRTYAVADDHPRIAELHEPWSTTGIFLVPVIRALTTMYLPSRGPRGNR